MFKRFSPSIVSFFVLALIILWPGGASAQTVRGDLWVTNGTVYDAEAVGDTLYVGGQFDYVGPATGAFGVAAAGTGAVEAGWPKINGTVKTVVSDGTGGWYVGGKFSSVGGVAIYNLAHVKSDKSVDTNWNPNVSRGQFDDVKDIEVAGGVLYVGGGFTQIGGQARKNLAAVDLTTGAATNWNPSPSGAVFEIEVIGGRIYVGGAITAIGLSGRSGAAAFDLATGALLDWKPVMTWNTNNVFAGVNAFVSLGNTVYIGGWFTSVGGQARNGLAAVDAVTGALLPWNPNPQDASGARVEALAISGSTVYVGGKFLEIGGLGIKHLAAVDASTGAVSPAWTPNPGINEGEYIDHRGPYVSTIIVRDGVLYVAGAFRRIGGVARRGLAVLDAATGTTTSFEANTNDIVNDLAVESGQVVAGGDFKSMGGVRRRNLAAFNLTTGRATDWNPDTESSSPLYSVKALATDGGATLYVAGSFERIGGRARKGLAEVNRTTGAATDWYYSTSSTPPSNVSDLEVTPTMLYVAGSFTVYRGTTQLNHLVAVRRTTGALADFAPQPDYSVADVEISDGVLYVGGSFRQIAGQQRIHAASFDLGTGALRAWKIGFNPESNVHHTGVSALAVANGKVYVGGHLPETIESPSPGAPPVTYGYGTLAAFNVSDGRLFSSWHPRPNFRVREIEVVGATCYIAGAFWEIGTDAQPQFAAAAVHSETGALADWKLFQRSEYSGGEGLVEKFIVKDGLIYVVGAFSNLKGSGHSHIAGVTPPVLSNVNPTVSLSVTVNGTTTAAPSSVAVHADTSVSFAASVGDVDGSVTKVDFYAGTTLLGTAASSPYILTTAQLAAGEYMIKAIVTDDRGGTGESASIRLTVLQPEQKLSISGRVVDEDGVNLIGVTVRLGGAGNATTQTDADGRYAFNDLTPGAAYALTPVLAGYDFQPEGYRYASLGANEDASFVAYRQTSSNEYSSNLWIPNGAVRASVVRGDTLYIGGDFTSLRGIGEHGAVVSTVTGAADGRFGKINGKVYAVVPDGAGGWYVGGTFTSARGLEGNVARRNLAHLLPDGTLDETWNPGANGKVHALAVVGTTLYVGGSFTEIADGARKGVAALDGATGALTAWDAQLDMASQRTGLPLTVNALLVSGDRLFVGGVFDTAGGGVHRANMAQFNLTTGNLTEWEIGARAMGQVRSLALSEETGTLYIGGIIFFPGESQGKYFATVDATTGASRAGFNPPRPGGHINSMAVVGNNLYIAGDFSGFQEVVGNQTITYFRKGGVALLDATTGAIKDWNPVLQHSGNTGTYGSVLLAVNSTVYVGGGFTHAGGEGSVPATASQTRTGLAAYDASTGALTSWNPVTGGNVTAFALNGTSLFVGSSPATAGVERKHLAAIDINTGQPTDWNPGADGSVHDLALGDTTIFVAGRFKNIGGARHLKAAEVELATGRVTEWNPSANLDNFVDPPPVGFGSAPDPRVSINEIAVAGGRVLLGGKFDSPDTDLGRPALIAVSRTSGQILDWDAGFAAGSEVRELLVDGDTVYVGGKFTAVGGQTRANLAALNIATAELNAWSPSVTSAGNASDAHVAALAIAGGGIYVGGDFGEVGGQAHRDLAEVSLQTAQPTLWNPDVKPLTAGDPAYVESVSITGSLVYAGGSFGFVGDAERRGLAAIDRATGRASNWNPQVSGGDVLTVTTSTFGSKIFMGGAFTSALGLGEDRAYLIGVRNPDPLSHNLVPKVDIRVIQGIIQSGITLEGGDGLPSVEPTTESDPLYRVELNADASDNDGQVTRVEFYNGGTLLGTDTATPFSFDWNNVAAGAYTVTARAIDNKGASTTSRPLNVTVGRSPIRPPAPTSRYTNMALGKPTSQSSTLTGGTSARAVDGNTSGDWSAGSVTLTNADPEAWWEVDLGSVGAIQMINIWNRTDCCGERLGDFYVLVSSQPFTSMNRATTLAQPGVYRYRFTGSLNAATAIPVHAQGRYVRVQLSGTNNLSLAEVEVLTKRTSRVKRQVGTLPGSKFSKGSTVAPKGNTVAPTKK